jgi:hypothetical protein
VDGLRVRGGGLQQQRAVDVEEQEHAGILPGVLPRRR